MKIREFKKMKLEELDDVSPEDLNSWASSLITQSYELGKKFAKVKGGER